MNSKVVAEKAIHAGAYAGIGVGVAQATNLLKPPGGALFGVVAFVSGKLIAEGLNKFFGDSSAEKILKFVAEYFGGLLVALGVMIQIGYKIKLATSLTLAMWMLPLACLATEVALPVIMKQMS